MSSNISVSINPGATAFTSFAKSAPTMAESIAETDGILKPHLNTILQANIGLILAEGHKAALLLLKPPHDEVADMPTNKNVSLDKKNAAGIRELFCFKQAPGGKISGCIFYDFDEAVTGENSISG